jgi:hypothetical protein
MKNLIPFLFVLVCYSCDQEESFSPKLGKATFSISETNRDNGRIKETIVPAFVLLSIEDSKGGSKEHIKLPLYTLGQSYLSTNVDMQAGTYQLTQFAVLDESNKGIYATPLEGSDLARYVENPLPIEFTIEEDQNTLVVPQVLAVYKEDTPGRFGLASFVFDIVSKIDKVLEVVYTDLFVESAPAISTMNFQYEEGKVKAIHWNIDYAAGDIHRSYLEQRFYATDGNLDSLSGQGFNGGLWNLSYQYRNGLRYKVVSTRQGNTATATFTDYKGAKPEHIENFYGVYEPFENTVYPHATDLEFDDAGDLISQKNTGIPGYEDRVREKTTVYGSELNPLRNLIEIPLPQVFGFYDDLAFYFSTHLPSSVESNDPYIDPVHNRIIFEYEKDIKGRVTRVKALRPDRIPRYTLDITYKE